MSIKLIHGDCLEVMPNLPVNGMRMIFADLPYSCTQHKWDTHIDMVSFWSRVKKFQCSAIVLSAIQPFASRLILSNVKNFKYDLIWAKERGTGHLSANKRPMRSHENILVFKGTGPSIYNAQKTFGHAPSRSSGVKHKENEFYGSKLIPTPHGVTSRHPLSVQQFPSDTLLCSARQKQKFHPTQKPVALLEWLIRTYTNEGDTVLDPVAGSGTTGVACLRTGRNFIGIEKDKTYFDAAKKRIEDEQERLIYETPKN